MVSDLDQVSVEWVSGKPAFWRQFYTMKRRKYIKKIHFQ